MNYACNCLWGQITNNTFIKPHFWQDPNMIMYAPFFWAGAQLVCMQLPFNKAPRIYAIRGPMNYACNCPWWQHTIRTCMKPHFWQDPKVIMYAPLFWAGAQLICMQLPFDKAPRVYAIRGPMNYACNCLWGQHTN